MDKGTGLGLAVVHGIVQAHDGEIVVQSQPGHGTAFVVYFPAASDAMTSGAQSDAIPVPASADEASTRHVLLVEDDPHLRDLESTRLRHLGYSVTACPDANAALVALREPSSPIDLVLTDYAMPDMDGLALVRRLREQDFDGPIVVMSVYGGHLSEEDVRDAGADAFLHKPVGGRQLRRCLREVRAFRKQA